MKFHIGSPPTEALCVANFHSMHLFSAYSILSAKIFSPFFVFGAKQQKPALPADDGDIYICISDTYDHTWSVCQCRHSQINTNGRCVVLCFCAFRGSLGHSLKKKVWNWTIVVSHFSNGLDNHQVRGQHQSLSRSQRALASRSQSARKCRCNYAQPNKRGTSFVSESVHERHQGGTSALEVAFDKLGG